MNKNSKLRNISNVIRYSGFKLLQPEDVGTHTMDMNVLALLLHDEIKDSLPKDYIDIKDLIYRITVHDLEESCSCDVPRTLKYYSDAVYEAINSATMELYKKEVSENLVRDTLNAKDLTTVEGRLVKFLDIYQCTLVLYREVHDFGNRPLIKLLKDSRNLLHDVVFKKDLFKDDHEVLTDYIKVLVSNWCECIKESILLNK